jgi:hypothetical protein
VGPTTTTSIQSLLIPSPPVPFRTHQRCRRRCSVVEGGCSTLLGLPPPTAGRTAAAMASSHSSASRTPPSSPSSRSRGEVAPRAQPPRCQGCSPTPLHPSSAAPRGTMSRSASRSSSPVNQLVVTVAPASSVTLLRAAATLHDAPPTSVVHATLLESGVPMAMRGGGGGLLHPTSHRRVSVFLALGSSTTRHPRSPPLGRAPPLAPLVPGAQGPP